MTDAIACHLKSIIYPREEKEGGREEEKEEHHAVAAGQVKEDEDLNQDIRKKNKEKDTDLKTT